jgi:hypothetical protein
MMAVPVTVVLGVVTLFLLDEPWPTLLILAVLVLYEIGALTLWRSRLLSSMSASETLWWQVKAVVLYRAFVVMMLALTAANAYYRAEPLPDARIHTRTRIVIGPLIANTDGFIFVGARDDDGNLHQEVPAARALSVIVNERKRTKERSVLEIIGLK